MSPDSLSLHKARLMDSTPEGRAGSGRGGFSELEPPGPAACSSKGQEPSLSASFLTPLSNCDGRAWPQASLISLERHPGDGFTLALASREQVVAAAEEICSWAPEAQPGWAPRAHVPSAGRRPRAEIMADLRAPAPPASPLPLFLLRRTWFPSCP